MCIFLLIFLAVVLTALAALRVSLWICVLVLVALTIAGIHFDAPLLPVVLAALVAVPLIVLATPLRRVLISDRLFAWFKKVMPPISATEREALDAGTVWWDAEIFSGRPRWRRLAELPKPGLSQEEQAFVDGPVEEFCAMLDDWQINHEHKDLPPEAWEFLRRHRFFSLIIPKEHGGLEFSKQANAAVVMKIASRSMTAATTVMVPNSLGPGELLHHFGTTEQQQYYLPRLASHEEIPCFALTAPLAGSDAASMPDEGIVCREVVDGHEMLGLRVNWDKRYITLAPVATLVGLAFKVRDPDGLLGGAEHLGITCALIAADTPGVEIGNRHLPGGSMFMNGPIRGTDVFIPMDRVIGGQERIGQGWRMLMHCLSAGRAISLPATGIANGKFVSLVTGAYARIRRQFKQPVGYFEGIEEALARIAGNTYRMDAAQRLTLVAADHGEKPAVLSAILKYHLTEGNRLVLNDAMDVHGGKGVIEGPNNYLSKAFQSIPVAITVEGANILTRCMIIFGQGAIRCHPYLLQEMQATQIEGSAGRKAFDRALWGHIGYLLSNAVRTPLLALTGGWLSRFPTAGPMAWGYRRINRLTVAFTLIADLVLLILGGKFKFKEKLSGRLGDALSHLYMASAVLKRFEDDDQPAEDLPLVEWALRDSLHRVEEALHGVLDNFPLRMLGPVLKAATFPLGRRHRLPNDALGHRVARLLIENTSTRQRLTRGVYVPTEERGAGLVLAAFQAVLATETIEQSIRTALKLHVDPANAERVVGKAVAAGVITEAEGAEVLRAQALVARAIAVDEFTPETLARD